MNTVDKECAQHGEYFYENEGHKKWKRNGRTQVWKTRPDDYRVPLKHGLYRYAQLTPTNSNLVHCECQCYEH